MKWMKYTPVGVLPSKCCAFRWMEIVIFGTNPVFFAYLLCCILVYLREFGGFGAFFPLNEMLHFLCFFLPFAHMESLLLAS
jgi:hypothetical protein